MFQLFARSQSQRFRGPNQTAHSTVKWRWVSIKLDDYRHHREFRFGFCFENFSSMQLIAKVWREHIPLCCSPWRALLDRSGPKGFHDVLSLPPWGTRPSSSDPTWRPCPLCPRLVVDLWVRATFLRSVPVSGDVCILVTYQLSPC